MLGMYLGPGVECGSADLQMFTCVKCGFQCGSKSALCPLVKIFFATSYLKNLRTLHCYYCRYFNVMWMYIAVDCYFNDARRVSLRMKVYFNKTINAPECCSFSLHARRIYWYNDQPFAKLCKHSTRSHEPTCTLAQFAIVTVQFKWWVLYPADAGGLPGQCRYPDYTRCWHCSPLICNHGDH